MEGVIAIVDNDNYENDDHDDSHIDYEYAFIDGDNNNEN